MSRRSHDGYNWAEHYRWKRIKKLNGAEHLSFREWFYETSEDGAPPIIMEAPTPLRRRIRTYRYRDEHGAELFTKVRFALTWPIGYVCEPVWRQVYPGDRLPAGQQLQRWPERLIGTQRTKDFR